MITVNIIELKFRCIRLVNDKTAIGSFVRIGELKNSITGPKCPHLD